MLRRKKSSITTMADYHWLPPQSHFSLLNKINNLGYQSTKEMWAPPVTLEVILFPLDWKCFRGGHVTKGQSTREDSAIIFTQKANYMLINYQELFLDYCSWWWSWHIISLLFFSEHYWNKNVEVEKLRNK